MPRVPCEGFAVWQGSLLLEVRTSLAFRDVTALTACLRHIALDPEVTVLATDDSKMRLSERYDAKLTGGYRDVPRLRRGRV